MKRIVTALIGALLVIGLGSAAGMAQPPRPVDPGLRAMFPDSIRQAGVLRVGVSAPQPPFVMLGQLGGQDFQGVDADLARLVAERAGLKVEFRNLAFSGLLAALQADQVDMLWTGLLPSRDRLAVANFVIYFRNPFGILVAEGNPLNIQSVSDLCGRRVARVEGSTPPAMIIEERQAVCRTRGLKPIEVTVYPNTVTSQLAIKSGASDAMVGAGAAAAYVAATVEDGKGFDHVVDLEGLGGVTYFADGVAILRDNTPLLNAVQRTLQATIDDGSYMAVLRKHGQEQFAVTKASINTFD